MQNEQSNNMAPEVERIIDRVGMEDFMRLLVQICGGKAEHLRANWQDETAGRAWDALAAKLNKIDPTKVGY